MAVITILCPSESDSWRLRNSPTLSKSHLVTKHCQRHIWAQKVGSNTSGFNQKLNQSKQSHCTATLSCPWTLICTPSICSSFISHSLRFWFWGHLEASVPCTILALSSASKSMNSSSVPLYTLPPISSNWQLNVSNCQWLREIFSPSNIKPPQPAGCPWTDS